MADAGIDPSAPTGSAKLEATPFRGDFRQLAALMQRVWGANREIPLLYTAELLESTFQYPGADLHFAPAIYAGEELRAFIAGLPRRFAVDGQERRVLLTTFLTAASEAGGPRYGISLWREIYQRARTAGLDGALSLCVEGDDMNRMVAALGRLCRFNTQHVFAINYLTRFLRPAKGRQPASAEQEVDLFLELTSEMPRTVPFARLWSREEAIWECRTRTGALTVSARYAQRRGMLTGYLVQVGSKPPGNALSIENVLWGDLEPAERNNLLKAFLDAAAARGAQAASCPVMNYADLEPFRAAGFRPSKRRVHVFLTTWTGAEPREFPAVYMEVL